MFLACQKPLQTSKASDISGHELTQIRHFPQSITALTICEPEPPFKSFSWNPKPSWYFHTLKTARLINASLPLAHFYLRLHLIILTSLRLWNSHSKHKVGENSCLTRSAQLVHSFFLDYRAHLWGLSNPTVSDQGRIKVDMWAHNQPASFSRFKPSRLSHENKEPSLPDLWEQYQCHTPQVSPLKLSDQPVLLSRGPISLKQIRVPIVSDVCKYTYVPKPHLCYWSWWSSETGMWSCDKGDNKAAEAIGGNLWNFLILFIFSQGALILGILHAALWLRIQRNKPSHVQTVDILLERRENWGFSLFPPQFKL